MTSKQRIVASNLGKNITSEHEQIYNYIESKNGQFKQCNFGHKRGSKTGVKHEGEENVPIRDFELRGCSITKMNTVVIKDGSGLQGFCKDCSKKRRRRRLEMSREKNKGGYDTYEKEYGKTTKKCSLCNEDKNIRKHFKLSPGMECGIHNVCIQCSKIYGESMGDRMIKYRPDGNYKYNKKETHQHDDHIFPLAYGGTHEEINHQLISSKENLTKSSTIPFKNVMDINPLLLSLRWRPIIYEGQREKICITILKSRLFNAIQEENKHIYSMKDSDIEKIYQDYNKKNNRRINTKRCVEKIKKYCKEILKLEP
jgi:hypothetical protein